MHGWCLPQLTSHPLTQPHDLQMGWSLFTVAKSIANYGGLTE